MFVYMLSLKSGPAHKLTKPFFRVVAVHPKGAEVVQVDKPRISPGFQLHWWLENQMQVQQKEVQN